MVNMQSYHIATKYGRIIMAWTKPLTYTYSVD